MTTPIRMLVVQSPDWSVTAAGFPSSIPVAVIHANRVVVCSKQARNFGVSVGDRKRSAQSVCPNIEIIQQDIEQDERAFESVITAIEQFCPEVQIIEPGICSLAIIGPSRYFGGDEALIAQLRASVDRVLKPLGSRCHIGVAEGTFAACLAAQYETIVAPGKSPAFLAPISVHALDRPELSTLLRHLGIKTLGAFAKLDQQTVAARFGPDGLLAHRLASGFDASRVIPRPPTVDLSAEMILDPPAERVDVVAFAARTLTNQFLDKLQVNGLTTTTVSVEAHTEDAEQQIRNWRFSDPITETSLADRMRWQLDGWLSGTNGPPPTTGIAFVRLSALEVALSSGQQTELLNQVSQDTMRAERGFARLQGQLGLDAVRIAHVVEGRDPNERITLTSWGEAPPKKVKPAPWPGSVPAPSPTVVHQPNTIGVELIGQSGQEVTVSRRGVLSDTPTALIRAGTYSSVIAFAGPWTNDDRWWDRATRRRRAFLQIQTTNGIGHLVTREHNYWWLEATYD